MIVKASCEYDVCCYENYHIPYHRKLKWHLSFHNLVTLAGLNKVLDSAFKTGVTSPKWYVGLKSSGAISSSDRMNSHPGWTEIINYTNSKRPIYTPGTIAGGSVDNIGSKAVFLINLPVTLYGCFLTNENTKNGTTGTLYGVGDFPSSQLSIPGDTITVGITLTQIAG